MSGPRKERGNPAVVKVRAALGKEAVMKLKYKRC